MSSNTTTTQTNNTSSQPVLRLDTSVGRSESESDASTMSPEDRDVVLPSPISPSALDFGLREPMQMQVCVRVEVHQVVESRLEGELLDEFGVPKTEVVSRCCATLADCPRSS